MSAPIEQKQGDPAPESQGDPVCECGETEGVTWDVDPFASEIHETDIWAWRCPSCLHESAMDI